MPIACAPNRYPYLLPPLFVLSTFGDALADRPPKPGKPGLFDGMSVMSGHSDSVFRLARYVKSAPGYYDFVVHGNLHKLGLKVTGKSGTLRTVLVSPDEAVKFLRATGYREGPVRLVACRVGELANGPAQDVANLIQAPVLAPTTEVMVPGLGLEHREGDRVIKGEWKKFLPRPGVSKPDPLNVPFRAQPSGPSFSSRPFWASLSAKKVGAPRPKGHAKLHASPLQPRRLQRSFRLPRGRR